MGGRRRLAALTRRATATIFGLIGQAGQAVLHVFLDVPAGELHRRIDAQRIHEAYAGRDADARAFRHRNVERCVAARAALPPRTVILRGDQHTPAGLAGLVLNARGQACVPAWSSG